MKEVSRIVSYRFSLNNESQNILNISLQVLGTAPLTPDDLMELMLRLLAKQKESELEKFYLHITSVTDSYGNPIKFSEETEKLIQENRKRYEEEERKKTAAGRRLTAAFC